MTNFLIIILIVLLLFLVFLFRKELKKYWKYLIILIPFVLVVVIKYILRMKNNEDIKREDDILRKEIDDVKSNIEETQLEYIVEVTASRTKNKEMLEQLKEIKKISDKKERRKKLASLIG